MIKKIENSFLFVAHIFLLVWILYIITSGGAKTSQVIFLHFIGLALYGALLILGSAFITKRRFLRDHNLKKFEKKTLWQEELKEALTTWEQVSSYFDLHYPKMIKGTSINQHLTFRPFIPLGLAQRIKIQGPHSALWKQFIPNFKEEIDSTLQNQGSTDPIGDQRHMKTKQLIHRYPNRALLLPTTVCPVHCRYCFRQNELSSQQFKVNSQEFTDSFNYLIQHPEIEEIILTGGDPLMLSDEKLLSLGQELIKIKSIKYLRIHTRMPVIIPDRMDKGLADVLNYFAEKGLKPIFVIHINHEEELSQSFKEELGQFRHHLQKANKNKIEFLSQSVLLKDVNNDVEGLKNLFQSLSDLNIRPYYLHHPDKVKGGMHFTLPLEEGRKILRELRHQLPGWMLPHYVVDLPGGEGKTWAYNSESNFFSGKMLNHKNETIEFFH
jgi:lysine 2,3-aminomutase